MTDPAGREYTIGGDRKLKSTRDLNGNTLTIAPDGVTSSAGNLKIAFTRDTQGRITKITDPLGKEYLYGYNALAADTYDNNGNTLSSNGVTLTYDFEDRLLTGNGVVNVYDGDGNRASRTLGGSTTKYLVDALTPTGFAQVAEELVGGAVTRRYTHGLQRLSQTQLISSVWTTHFYSYDDFAGSVRALTDVGGSVTDSYTFDAFGNLTAQAGTTPNVYLYRGEQLDPALGLYYLRARWYEPRTGRFMTADKWEPDVRKTCCAIVSSPLWSTAQHLFSYTNGDPVNFIDPAGTNRLNRWLFIGVFVVQATHRNLVGLMVRVASATCKYILAGIVFVEHIEWFQFFNGGTLPTPDYKDWIKAYCNAMGY